MERFFEPHAVYRIFDKDGTLLYVGCSSRLLSRLYTHSLKEWGTRMARIELEWYDDKAHAAVAEARAILDERPLLNGTEHPPERLGAGAEKVNRAPRGDGVTCPKCGRPKETPKKPYCRSCARAYQAAYRLAKQAAG